jgi:hypothetical protein
VRLHQVKPLFNFSRLDEVRAGGVAGLQGAFLFRGLPDVDAIVLMQFSVLTSAKTTITPHESLAGILCPCAESALAELSLRDHVIMDEEPTVRDGLPREATPAIPPIVWSRHSAFFLFKTEFNCESAVIDMRWSR